jgi:mortality factor 4-like protein 1
MNGIDAENRISQQEQINSNSNSNSMDAPLEERPNDGNAPSSSEEITPPPFNVDERVFCKEGDAIYQAIIRKARRNNDGNGWSFLVHYLGWNARWDRWTSSDHLFSNTPENKLLLETKSQQHEPITVPATASAVTDMPRKRGRNSLDSTSMRTTKLQRKSTSTNIKRQTASATYADFCELPFTLKTVLVDDCERITRTAWDSQHGYDFENPYGAKRKHTKPARVVHNLPATITVRKILHHFRKKQIQSMDATVTSASLPGCRTTEQVQEFCLQLGQLFSEALPACLLYPEERPQYNALVKQQHEQRRDDCLLDTYGCVHLLRLFVRLPALMMQKSYVGDHKTARTFGPLLAELLVLMQKNKQLFGGIYRDATPDEWLDWEQRVYHDKNKEWLPIEKDNDNDVACTARNSLEEGAVLQRTQGQVAPPLPSSSSQEAMDTM